MLHTTGTLVNTEYGFTFVVYEKFLIQFPEDANINIYKCMVKKFYYKHLNLNYVFIFVKY